MVCRAGVDEAGLGPILGPLTVGGLALEMGDGENPYEILREVVARKGEVRRDPRILVDDSKRVCSGPKGIGKVERTALAFLSLAWGSPPESAHDLASRLEMGGGPQDLTGVPWLETLDLKLPFAISPGQVELDGWRLERAAKAGGFRIPAVTLLALHPARFNERIRETGNKSRTHFEMIARVLGTLLDLSPREVVLDRTGGLIHHSGPLARAFPGVGVTRLGEEKSRQGYLLRMGRGVEVEVWFREKAEDHSFAVALASCMAKYVREVFMECQNRWFCHRIPGLKPTRGYYVDGHRFLGEVERVIHNEKLNPGFFVRSR